MSLSTCVKSAGGLEFSVSWASSRVKSMPGLATPAAFRTPSTAWAMMPYLDGGGVGGV